MKGLKEFIAKMGVVVLLVMVSLACSQRSTYTDTDQLQMDSAAVVDNLNGLLSSNASLQEVAGNKTTTIYYAENGIGLGGVENVLAVPALEYLMGPEFAGFKNDESFIENVKVYFVDLNASDARVNFLTLVVTPFGSSPVVRTFTEQGQSVFTKVDNDTFMVELVESSTGSRILLQSTDLEEGSTSLDATIQLEVYIDINGGGYQYAGKFPTLVGLKVN